MRMTAKRLPESIEHLKGRRAARWVRESTSGQFDRFGPDSQREQQDRAIARHGLIDSGHVFELAISGKIAWRHPTMLRMVEDAKAGAFDVLLVGYSDRWQRNLRQTLNLLEDDLHPSGVAVLFADRRILRKIIPKENRRRSVEGRNQLSTKPWCADERHGIEGTGRTDPGDIPANNRQRIRFRGRRP
jgi:hypothetical protein